jgi:hypothetical protein
VNRIRLGGYLSLSYATVVGFVPLGRVSSLHNETILGSWKSMSALYCKRIADLGYYKAHTASIATASPDDLSNFCLLCLGIKPMQWPSACI